MNSTDSTADGARRRGFPIVLTADRTLIAGHRLLLDGMITASQTNGAPAFFVKGFLAPRAPGRLRAVTAPLGLRRIEAALLAGGFARADVAVVAPESLSTAVGPDTRIVGLSSGDPLGLGMNTNTMEGIAGGRAFTHLWFRRLCAELARHKSRRAFKLVAGGPGAWQLTRPGAMSRLGIDCVVAGYAESCVADVFRRIVSGRELGQLEECPPGATPLPIRGASTMGVVEISRGCGRGCGFCSIRSEPMRHASPSLVCADVDTNLAAGSHGAALISEDFFRYGAAPSGWAAPQALLDLLRELRRIKSLGPMQIDHANVASIARFDSAALAEVRALLAGPAPGFWPWVNVGVETASAALLCHNGGACKIRPHRDEDWPGLCREQVTRLASAGFMPMVSLVMGLEGETPSDVEKTLAWVRGLRNERVTIFPMFCAPLDDRPPFTTRDMTRLHWRLFQECYELNFRWMPRLFWNNQTAFGISLPRRLAIQALGRGQVAWWRMLFALRSRGWNP
ncbi:MAG TPA: hypothetical protein P5137_07020 [Candidatus Brocadiia bacterium]|nr:hypothetical protein [Candidatus Brocadiia bacterium]